MQRNTTEKNAPSKAASGTESISKAAHSMVKLEVFGEEMLEKRVSPSGNSGRIYLPPEWIGYRIKVIRID